MVMVEPELIGGNVGVARRGDKVRRQFRAVDPAPAEAVVRELIVLVPRELGGNHELNSRLPEELRQCGRETERIRQPRHLALYAQCAAAVADAIQELPHQ